MPSPLWRTCCLALLTWGAWKAGLFVCFVCCLAWSLGRVSTPSLGQLPWVSFHVPLMFRKFSYFSVLIKAIWPVLEGEILSFGGEEGLRHHFGEALHLSIQHPWALWSCLAFRSCVVFSEDSVVIAILQWRCFYYWNAELGEHCWWKIRGKRDHWRSKTVQNHTEKCW